MQQSNHSGRLKCLGNALCISSLGVYGFGHFCSSVISFSKLY